MEGTYIYMPEGSEQWSNAMLMVWVRLWLTVDEKGERNISRSTFAKECGLSEQSLRTTIAKLTTNQAINQQPTNRLTKITINNYDSYKAFQPANQPTTNQPTNQPNLEVEVVKKTPKPRKKPESTALFSACRKIYEDGCTKLFGTPPYFTPTDAGKLRDIIKKIIFVNNGSDEQVVIEGIFRELLNTAYRDKWIKDHFSLGIISSKYDELIRTIKQKNDERERQQSAFPGWQPPDYTAGADGDHSALFNDILAEGQSTDYS